MNKATIILNEFKPAQVIIEKAGAKHEIYMNVQDLVQQLIGSMKADDDIEVIEKPTPVVVSPSLPMNTVKYSKLSDETDIVFLNHPEVNVDIRYHNHSFEQVPVPNLVFALFVRNNRIVNKYVFCYKDRFLRDESLLYIFPYANVFEWNGSLCYYNNQEVKDLVQLQTYPMTWLSEPFNDHLYHQGSTNKFNKPLRQILEETQHTKFDYSKLKETGKTFAGWSTSLIVN